MVLKPERPTTGQQKGQKGFHLNAVIKNVYRVIDCIQLVTISALMLTALMEIW